MLLSLTSILDLNGTLICWHIHYFVCLSIILPIVCCLCRFILLDGFLKNDYWNCNTFICVPMWGHALAFLWTDYYHWSDFFENLLRKKSHMAWHFSYMPLSCHVLELRIGKINCVYVVIHWHFSSLCYMDFVIVNCVFFFFFKYSPKFQIMKCILNSLSKEHYIQYKESKKWTHCL